MHSQRVRDTSLTPWLIVEDCDVVKSANCNCMAGLGESCTHVGALLFAMECYVRQRETKTVTQNKAYWIVPATKEVEYAPVSKIDFTSAASKRKNLDLQLEKGLTKVKQPKVYKVQPPTEAEILSF